MGDFFLVTKILGEDELWGLLLFLRFDRFGEGDLLVRFFVFEDVDIDGGASELRLGVMGGNFDVKSMDEVPNGLWDRLLVFFAGVGTGVLREWFVVFSGGRVIDEELFEVGVGFVDIHDFFLFEHVVDVDVVWVVDILKSIDFEFFVGFFGLY